MKEENVGFAIAVLPESEFKKNHFAKLVSSSKREKSSKDSTYEIAKWYDDSKNLFPNNILDVLINNNITPTILDTKAKFIVGSQVETYKEIIEQGKRRKEIIEVPEAKDFLSDEDLPDTLFNLAKDIQYFGNGFPELSFNPKGQIAKLYHHDATTARASFAQEKGRSKMFKICTDWEKPKSGKYGNMESIQGWLGYEKNNGKNAMLQIKDYTPGHPHYALPAWYGTMRWIELANMIPMWHLHGIRNGYNIRYIIEVSESYFASISPEKRAEAKKLLQSEMDAYLSGETGSGKTIFSMMPQQIFDAKGIIRITPIPTDLHDEAFTVLFEQSNIATTSGLAMDPTLAGIETAGKLSSGSDKRISYEIFHNLHAPRFRNQILKIFTIVSKVNKWDVKYEGLKFGFSNIELTKLDENPTGKQQVI